MYNRVNSRDRMIVTSIIAVAVIIVIAIGTAAFLFTTHNQKTITTTSSSQTTFIQTSAVSGTAPSIQLFNDSISVASSSTITIYFYVSGSAQNYTYLTVASPGTMPSELAFEQEWTTPPLPAGMAVSFGSLSVTGASVNAGDDYATVQGTSHFVVPVTITLSSVPLGNHTLEFAAFNGEGTGSAGTIQDFTLNVSSTTTSITSTTSTSAAPLVNPSTRIPIEGYLEGQPEAIAYDPVNNLVLIVGTDDLSSFPFETDLYVVNATTNEILYSESLGPVTTNAHEIAYDPANQEMYVSATSLSSTSCCNTALLPISLSTPYTVLPSVNVSESIGGTPLMQFDPANNETFVTLQGTNHILALNTVNEVVTNITTNFVTGLGYDPLLGDIYVSANSGTYLISANNSISGSVEIEGGDFFQFDPANGYMYMVSGLGGITVLNGTQVVGHSGVSTADAISFDPQNSDLYVSSTNTITVIDKSDNVVVTIDAPSVSGGVYDAKQGLMVFAGPQLYMIDSANQITRLGNVPSAPYQSPPLYTTMAYDPQNGCVYTLAPQNDSASVFC